MSNVQNPTATEPMVSLRVDVPKHLKLRLVNDKVNKSKSMNETTTVALTEYYERQDKQQ